MSMTIPLTQNKVAIVDDADFEWLNQWKWCAHKERAGYYAIRGIWINGKTRRVYMHRLILNLPPDMQTDHINGNGLDNRRLNLRVCTQSQNNANRRKWVSCSSQYKGITWDKLRGKWQARINLNGEQKHLGRFDDEHEAAVAYNEAATKLFDGFARLNVIMRSKEK
ncbi:MAG TPA: HNH endonuclease, partial [Anaerolineae bacterium]|nr:HNH endonuclease [Anaerolineae bacterium]